MQKSRRLSKGFSESESIFQILSSSNSFMNGGSSVISYSLSTRFGNGKKVTIQKNSDNGVETVLVYENDVLESYTVNGEEQQGRMPMDEISKRTRSTQLKCSETIKNVATVVAFVVGGAVFVILACVVCCSCCPCCLLVKRKERGRVISQKVYAQPPPNSGATSQSYPVFSKQNQQAPMQPAFPSNSYNQPISATAAPYSHQVGPVSTTQRYMNQPPPYPGQPIQQGELHQPAGQFGD